MAKEVSSTGPGTITPRWEKGESGNPNGRPVGAKSWSTVIREMVDDPDFEIKFKDGTSRKWPAKVMTEVMIRKAASGDVQAVNFLAKYHIGEKLDITSMGEKLELPAVYLPERKND